MADFNEEFEKLVFAEGGYVNDPDDKGGETYLGISRKHNPAWGGWGEIDKITKSYPKESWNYVMKHDDFLTNSAREFYKRQYWNCFDLDDCSQSVAHQMFDTAVNMGVSKAIRIAQRIVGMKETGRMSKELTDKLASYGNTCK